MSVPVRPRLSVRRGFSKGKPLWFYSPTASKTHLVKSTVSRLCHVVSRLVCVFFRLCFYQFRHRWLQSNCYVKKRTVKFLSITISVFFYINSNFKSFFIYIYAKSRTYWHIKTTIIYFKWVF